MSYYSGIKIFILVLVPPNIINAAFNSVPLKIKKNNNQKTKLSNTGIDTCEKLQKNVLLKKLLDNTGVCITKRAP